MNKITTFVGLDVHKKTIAVAVVHKDGEPRHWRTISNRTEAVEKMVKELGAEGTRYAYEAGPCGYGLYRQLVSLGAGCVVAAPSRIPKEPGDRVKTDRRDALKLARLLRRGDLRGVWVPSREQEAFRDLTRARQATKKDLQRIRNRTTKMLLRLELRPAEGMRNWTEPYWRWLRGLRLERQWQQDVLEELVGALDEAEARVKRLEELIQEAAELHPQAALIKALQALRGVKVITAATLVAELGDITRFPTPGQLMAYVGLVCVEDSSGDRVRRGHITRTGNAYLRHVLGEMAWHAARPVRVGKGLARRRQGQGQAILDLVQRAEVRLNGRYHRLVHRGKLSTVAATAVAREALGFIWAMARIVADLPVKPPRTQAARAKAA